MVQFVLPYKYERTGSCRKCGKCCKEILISIEPWMINQRWIRNFVIWWNEYFNDLRLICCVLDEGYFVFTCQHLTKSGKCGKYNWLRPWFCFEYPRIFNYFEIPTTLKGCGYSFKAKFSARK